MGLITRARLDALRTTFSLIFKGAYEGTEAWADKLATTIPSDNAFNTYGWMADQVQLREWTGARIAQDLQEHDAVIVNRTFEGTIKIQREKVEDDNLGVYSAQAVPQLAEATKKHFDLLIREFLAANPEAFDGEDWFSATHNTYAPAESVQTYSNLLTLALEADGVNFNTARVTMGSYIGESGRPMPIVPDLLIVPSALEVTANRVVKSAQLVVPVLNVAGNQNVAAGTIDNPYKGMTDVLVIPELNDDPTAWYLACTKKSIKPFVKQMRRAPQFVSKMAITDDNVFNFNEFVYGVDGRWNIGGSLPFLMLKSKP